MVDKSKKSGPISNMSSPVSSTTIFMGFEIFWQEHAVHCSNLAKFDCGLQSPIVQLINLP